MLPSRYQVEDRQHRVLSAGQRRLHRKGPDAILYCLVAIGEAVNNLSDEVKAAAPEIPWRQIVNLRNLLAHRYWKISFEAIERSSRRTSVPLEAAVLMLLPLLAPDIASPSTVSVIDLRRVQAAGASHRYRGLSLPVC